MSPSTELRAGPQIVSRELVLEKFRSLGATIIFEPTEPWHGHNLRDAFFKTVPVGRPIELRWHRYVSGLSSALKEGPPHQKRPRYIPERGDCDNHPAWFLAELQQEFAALSRAMLDPEEPPCGYGCFPFDFTSLEHGNHHALAFLHHDLQLHCFEVFTGQWFELQPEEAASIWSISGS